MKKITLILLLAILMLAMLPAQGWKIRGSMPVPVSGGKAIVKDSLIYIVGGFDESIGRITNIIQSFNPRTGVWLTVDTMKFGRTGFIAGDYNGNFVYTGGSVPGFGFHNALEVYDYHNTPFVHSSHTVFRRSYAAGEIVDSNLFVFGGYTLEPDQPEILKYNIPRGRVESTGGTAPSPLQFPLDQMTARLGSDIYIFGGVRHSVTSKIFKYSIENGTFTELYRELPGVRAGGSAIKIDDATVMLVGGYDQINPALSTSEVLRLTGDGFVIVSAPGLNVGRTDPMTVKFGDSIYVFGGEDVNGDVTASIEVISVSGVTSVKSENTDIPAEFELLQNFPNPFNASTTIRFKTVREGNISLDIYSADGSLIKVIEKGFLPAGEWSYRWDGTDFAGSPVASGVYIITLTDGMTRQSRKMTCLK